MGFDNENSQNNTETRNLQQIQYSSVPYHGLHGDKTSTQYNHPIQNGSHKPKFSQDFIEIHRINMT